MAYGRSATGVRVNAVVGVDYDNLQRVINPIYLLIRLSIAKTPLSKVVELHALYNFALVSIP